jgi:DNA polymerase III epsilon subunit-like protein
MDSVLRDINREQSKMQADVDNLHRHYEKLMGYVRQYVEQTTVEWAKLVASHQKTLLLVVETTRIVDETGYSYGGESEPIRFTGLLTSGEIWDQLLHPTHSKAVLGAEYHGLQWSDLEGKPTISEAWPNIEKMLEDHHVVIYGADYASKSLQSVFPTHVLSSAYCLHNKCKEYYGEFYELSLEKVLSYQAIDKKRGQLTNSRDRVLMLAQVLHNLAANVKKQDENAPEAAIAASDAMLSDLDDHPF